MLKAWTGEPFEWQGRTIQATPKPLSQPHPTILVGGGVEAAARRAARLRLPMMPMNEDPRLSEWYADEAAKTGFEGGFVMTPSGPTFVHVSHDPERAWAEIAPYVLYEAQTYASFQTGGQHSTPMVDAEGIEDLKKQPAVPRRHARPGGRSGGEGVADGRAHLQPARRRAAPGHLVGQPRALRVRSHAAHPPDLVSHGRWIRARRSSSGSARSPQHAPDPDDALDASRADGHRGRAGRRGHAVSTGRPERVDLVLVPQGIWPLPRPGARGRGRASAPTRRAASSASSGCSSRRCSPGPREAIAAGDADVVLVAGAEAKHRALLAAKAGVTLDDPDPSAGDPDESLAPVGEILTAAEIERDLAMPAHEYAMIESTLAHVAHRTPDEQRAARRRALVPVRRVAAGRTTIAWDRRGLSAEEIATPGRRTG